MRKKANNSINNTGTFFSRQPRAAGSFNNCRGLPRPLLAGKTTCTANKNIQPQANPPWKFDYIHYLQGDIIALIDDTGAKVISYTYDAWGKPLSTTGSLANTLGKLNPFRYRGYVLDKETGLYYLRSRYYNADWCRFINADKYIERKSMNYMFLNCGSSPVCYIDPNGTWYYDDFTEEEDVKRIGYDTVHKAVFAKTTIQTLTMWESNIVEKFIYERLMEKHVISIHIPLSGRHIA